MVKKLFFLAIVSCFSLPMIAATVNPSIADIQNFTFTVGTNASGVVKINPPNNGAFFDVSVTNPNNWMSATFVSAGLNIGNSAGDVFQVSLMNSNSNPWIWTLTLYDTGGVLIGSDVVDPVGGAWDTFSIALSGNAIGKMELVVSGGPWTQTDYSADGLMAVPEPSTLSLLLIGSGILGYRTLRKRK